mmetsp:Transcript_12724/g.44191  ORF Transcript_12724/g.44191 Transcript_12724/m.44191 type:complete len:253 (-) Transcript_12724:232-990(-)
MAAARSVRAGPMRRASPRRSAPVPCRASSATARASTEVRRLLADAYDPADHMATGVGHHTSAEDRDEMRTLSTSQGPLAWTYGELTFDGMSELRGLIGAGPSDAFYDLGSGMGRLVLQAHLEWGCKRSVGVELSGERHRKGVKARARLESEIDTARELELVHGNLLELDCSAATVVYLACTCWDREFMLQVLSCVEPASCPNLRWLVTTESLERKFDMDPLPGWLRLHEKVRLKQSWADDYPVYLYKGPAED